ncbi:MAG: polymorphic toxin-type HINT domain-containing protein [Lysobacterales bacterium]
MLKHSDEAWAAIRGGCSFDGQTLVATDGNPTAIQDIRVGARVLARDEKTGEERYQKVTAVISEWHDEALEVTFQSDRSSETILTTDEHPFFEVGIGFVPASQLRVGAQVLRASGQLARVERMRETKGGLAWNLTVESDHTFFVGQVRYWVHNQCIRGVSGESPALGGSPYHPDAVNERIRPPYRANPQHDPGSADFRSWKSPEPSDAQAVYSTASRAGMGEWFGLGKGGWYRYFSDNAGGVHFSGVVNSDDVPIDLRRMYQ